jgi:WhiB family redox-sensing transcriptional regulator
MDTVNGLAGKPARRPSPEVFVKIAVPLGRWALRGLCADPDVVPDPEVFFPKFGAKGTAAKRICHVCPVRRQCLEHALAAPEKYGVWGGTDEVERRKLIRQRRRLAAKKKAAASSPGPSGSSGSAAKGGAA